MNALLRLHLVNQLFKIFLADFHDDIREHLDESAVGVIHKTLEFRVRISLNHRCNHFVVQTQIQNGVHHTGHGSACTGTNGNQKRILEIAELLAVLLFHLLHAVHRLSHDLIIDMAAIFVILCAGFRRDGEALRHRETDVGHFRKVCAFTAEKLAHIGISLVEHINPFCHLPFLVFLRRICHPRMLRMQRRHGIRGRVSPNHFFMISSAWADTYSPFGT